MTDILNYLPNNILPKVDRTTMAFGLEAREPLLDHRLLEYSTAYRIRISSSRSRNCPQKYFKKTLPNYQFDNQKRGFTVPLGLWMRKDLKEYILSSISQERIDNDQLLNANNFSKYLNEFMKSGIGNPKFIWDV